MPFGASHVKKRHIHSRELQRIGGEVHNLVLMKAEQHRAARHAFVARAEVVDLDSEKQLVARTGNLSTFGCFIETGAPFPRGTRIRMRITHRGTTFVAVGQVADSRATGMGVRFGSMEPAHQQILENWLAQLRNSAN